MPDLLSSKQNTFLVMPHLHVMYIVFFTYLHYISVTCCSSCHCCTLVVIDGVSWRNAHGLNCTPFPNDNRVEHISGRAHFFHHWSAMLCGLGIWKHWRCCIVFISFFWTMIWSSSYTTCNSTFWEICELCSRKYILIVRNLKALW